MQIRRYEVESLKAAHNLIRKELGAEAVILSAREIIVQGKKRLAVMAARDLPAEDADFPAQEQKEWSKSQEEFLSSLRLDLVEIKGRVSSLGKLADRLLANPGPAGACFSCRLREGTEAPQSPLRALLTEILAPSGLSRPLEEELYATLATRSQEKDYRQVSVIREELLALMTAGLEEIMPRKHDGRIKVYLGPTGTGKTTSLVKLAARYSWEKKLKVGLVTADTYRIAATEQLRIYAGIMGLPLLVARTAHDFQKSLAEFSSMDVIMVDTPGRNPRDTQELWKLQALLASGGETERNLVLSANVSLENLFQATEGYGIIGIDNVIFTKLDEGSRFGFLYDYLQTTRKAVSYLTDGQKVPEDIVPACAAKLARIICDGKLS